MMPRERIRLDIFQDSLVVGDILIDAHGKKFEYHDTVSCKWRGSCRRCRGSLLVTYSGDITKDMCFGTSSDGEQYSNVWHHEDIVWFRDKDFEL